MRSTRSSAAGLRTASDGEVRALWPTIRAAQLFATVESYRAFRMAAPWRLQVNAKGEYAVLEEWREHLDVLAVRMLGCADGRIPPLMDQIAGVARERGYGRLLSPLVPQESAMRYLRAGFCPWETLVIARLDRVPADIAERSPPPGITVRPAREDDLPALAHVDTTCFDEFWRYGKRQLEECLLDGRVAVAECSHGVVGYTLAMLMGRGGTIGRLAVMPPLRGRGVGEALLREAIAHLARGGARSVTLCTQDANLASRALYRKVGMTESPRRLVLLMGPVACADERE